MASTNDTDPGDTDVHDGPDVTASGPADDLPGDHDITDEIDTDPLAVLDVEAHDSERESNSADVLVAADDDHDDAGHDDPGHDGDPGLAPRRRRLDTGLLAACFVIAGGMMLIAWGLITAQTGDEGVDRPEAIENLSPVENALQVLQQEMIVVDLDFGYEAELILDGVELEITRINELDFDGLEPGQQVATPPTAVFDPGNSRIEFRPSEGAQIEELTEGRHTATVIYWRIDEGRENARSYTWSFDVI